MVMHGVAEETHRSALAKLRDEWIRYGRDRHGVAVARCRSAAWAMSRTAAAQLGTASATHSGTQRHSTT